MTLSSPTIACLRSPKSWVAKVQENPDHLNCWQGTSPPGLSAWARRARRWRTLTAGHSHVCTASPVAWFGVTWGARLDPNSIHFWSSVCLLFSWASSSKELHWPVMTGQQIVFRPVLGTEKHAKGAYHYCYHLYYFVNIFSAPILLKSPFQQIVLYIVLHFIYRNARRGYA